MRIRDQGWSIVLTLPFYEMGLVIARLTCRGFPVSVVLASRHVQHPSAVFRTAGRFLLAMEPRFEVLPAHSSDPDQLQADWFLK